MTGKCVKVLAFNHSFSFLALIRSLRLQAAKSRIDDGIPRSRKARDLGRPLCLLIRLPSPKGDSIS